MKRNIRIDDKGYCLKLYNFSFNQAKLKLPMSQILDYKMQDDDDYQDIWRDLFTEKLYEILDENVNSLNMVPTHGQASWQDWITEDQRKMTQPTGHYIGWLFALAVANLKE